MIHKISSKNVIILNNLFNNVVDKITNSVDFKNTFFNDNVVTNFHKIIEFAVLNNVRRNTK